MGTYLKAELYGPNVLTLDLTVDVIWARAIPNLVPLGDCIEAMTGL
jgi:hypothetical protein